jgi:hypothetical protein
VSVNNESNDVVVLPFFPAEVGAKLAHEEPTLAKANVKSKLGHARQSAHSNFHHNRH